MPYYHKHFATLAVYKTKMLICNHVTLTGYMLLNGRLVTFGGLTGADIKLNIQSLYSKQVKLIGSTGGTRKEITEVIDMSKELKTRVWKKFKLDEAKEALQELFAKERDGRILLEVS